MAERASLAVSNAPGQRGPITAEDHRYGIAAGYTPSGLVTARSGFRPSHLDPAKVIPSGTADQNVHVTAFQRVHASPRTGGVYVQTLDATKTINVLGSYPAHSSGITKHLLIINQNDVQFGDPDSDMDVILVPGSTGANADPSLADYEDYTLLARLNITANATTVTTGMIEDLRPDARFTVTSGGLLPITNQAERDAVANPYDGLPIWRKDRDWIEVYDGTAWRVQGLAICSSTADRDSAITHPHTGLHAVTNDTSSLWVYRPGGWTNARTLGLGAEVLAVKTTDKVVTNSAVLSADGQLVLTVQANARYALTGYLIYAADGAADAKFALTGPTGATAQISGYGVSTAETSSFGSLDTGVVALAADWQIGGAGAAVKRTCVPHGSLATAGTGGTVTLSVAQVVAQANNLTLFAGSWLSLKRMA